MHFPPAPVHYPFSYCFHAVGQGLFTSGAIRLSHTFGYRWVYDCGTSSSPKLIDREIERIGPAHDSTLDLVTISHFDHDHISGLCRLLKLYRVRILLLPYVPLWQRLLIAFEEKTKLEDPYMNFYVNPSEFVGNLGAGDDEPPVERILYVRSGEGSDTPGGDDEFFGGEPPWQAVYPEDDAWPDDLYSSRQRSEILRPGGTVRVPGLWEFVPYNDQALAPGSPQFETAVDKLRSDLLRGRDDSARQNALRNLKATYDRQFGSSSYKRNVISLFLYSGPVYGSWLMTNLFLSGQHAPLSIATGLSDNLHLPAPLSKALKVLGNVQPDWDWRRRGHESRQQELSWRHRHPGPLARQDKVSILYTGDGYLDTADRLDNLMRFLGRDRLARIGVFQVMHHGAAANCTAGVASSIDPLFSVFSSDPGHRRFRHPHDTVVDEFFNFGPIQVDKKHVAAFDGVLFPPP